MRRKAIATVSLSGTLEEKLAAAAAAGFDGVEIFENDLIASALRPAEIRELAERHGLSIDLYQPFRDFEAVPPDVFEHNVRRAEAKFDLMAELGAELLLVCSNVSPSAIDDDVLAADQLLALAERAAARGLRIAYEALAWGTHVDDYAHSWRIVEAADHPALGVCLDSFHILSRGDDPAGIRLIPGEKIFFLQLADAPQLLMDVLQWSRHYRSFPGQGALDLDSFLAHVLAAGYGGPLSLEIFNDLFRQADAARTAEDAMRSLLALEAAVEPEASGLARPPSVRRCRGVALTGDARVADDVARILGALDILDDESTVVSVQQTPTVQEEARIASVTLACADPGEALRRAASLHAGVHGAAIDSPDGRTIVLGTDDPARPERAAKLVTAIDHVALAQPFDSFDAATLFYRSVLGFELEPSQELAAPYGLIRSRAVVAGDRSVRIVLNVPVLGGTPSDAPDHVAFASADVFAAARALREAGIPVLSISDNYYDDLRARLDVPGDLLDSLRALDVLYDRSPDGEFLHVYTQPIGGRLHFEIVQRLGEYAGYGAANSAVRLAAQRRCDGGQVVVG